MPKIYGKRTLADIIVQSSAVKKTEYLELLEKEIIEVDAEHPDGGGGTPLVNVDDTNKQLTTGGDVSLDWASMRLLDASVVDSIHWGNRNLVNSDGSVVFDWENYLAFDSNGVDVFNWDQKRMWDDNGDVSLHWGNRQLVDDNENPILDWGTAEELKSSINAIAGNSLQNSYVVDTIKGNDTTGNGSFIAPYATLAKAATEIGAATTNAEFNDATKRYYYIKLIGNAVESVTFGTRPHIVLDLEQGTVTGNVTIQIDQGGIFGAGLQSPHFMIRGGGVRPFAGGLVSNGIVGNLVYESIGSGSSLVALLEIFRSVINGNIVQQLGSGGTFTLTNFISSGIVTGTISNSGGGGSHTLYVDNIDDSSSNSIGSISGVVNLNVLSNVRLNGTVVVSGSQSGRWTNVVFSGLAHDFTGSSGTITGDIQSLRSWFTQVSSKGSVAVAFFDVHSGTTANRPVSGSGNLPAGYQYFDTTLGKAIWSKGDGTWVDATGAAA